MSSPTRPKSVGAPPARTISESLAQNSSEPSTRSSSSFEDLNVASRRLAQADRRNTFGAEPLYMQYSPSITPDSSPPYTRQTSVVDLEALKKEPYVTVDSKSVHCPDEPYHVFSRGTKWTVVILIGVAGLFSGLSSNIYFPALDAIAKVSTTCLFNTCISGIDLFL